MIIDMPKDVNFIIERLEQAGYEAYAVGGCVRDSILKREPSDWDITTSARPEEIKALFRPTIDTGIQHGTVTVLRNHVGYEVTTYRIDGEYEDNRHPKDVVYTKSLTEDLKRRDFTINAMAYNASGLVDEFGGLDDIEKAVIRCVGDPKERFSEDALRMMRAVRFSAQLGYDIEEGTREAIKDLYGNLEAISAERINVELTKMLISSHPEYIRDCYELGITSVIMPELDECMITEQNNPHHCYSVGEHIIRSMQGVEDDKVLRYAMLFHDIGKPKRKITDEKGIDHFYGHAELSALMAHTIMKRLRFDNDTLYKVEKLVKYHDRKVEADGKSVRKAMNLIGRDLFPMLLKVKAADVSAQSDYKREQKEEELRNIWDAYDKVISDGDCVQISDLAINGSDLIARGMAPGPAIGEKLNYLLGKVIEEPSLNVKEKLLELLQ